MIDAYFAQIEQTLQAFPHIQSSTLTKKRYNARQGYISGSLFFVNRYRLEFIEVKDVDRPSKVKYRYQYMDQQDVCIFRYDDAPHHRGIATFPHHKHTEEKVEESNEPTLFDVLLEIAQHERIVNDDRESSGV
jgi:hypothetical protein